MLQKQTSSNLKQHFRVHLIFNLFSVQIVTYDTEQTDKTGFTINALRQFEMTQYVTCSFQLYGLH